MLKLCILVMYFITAMAAFYIILTGLKLKKHGRHEEYAHSVIMTAGRAARLISVAAFITAFVIYCRSTGGISYEAGAVIGIIQMLCIAVCVISAAVPVISYIAGKKGKSRPAGYIMNLFGNIFTVTAAVCFEMYCFWL